MNNQQKIELAGALTEFVKSSLTVNDSLVCTFKSYDPAPKTCYCVPIADYADIQQVRINPDSNKKGIIVFPKVDSIVLVSFLSDSSAYISMFSEIDEMRLGGDQYGGIAKTEPVATSLNNLENKVNALITAITAWTPVPNDGGAALKVALTSWLSSTVSPTMLSTITNNTIKHGDGIV